MSLPLTVNALEWSIDKEEGWNQDRIIKTYFHHSELQRQTAWKLVGNADLKDKHILDFGCGDGKITAELSQLVHQGSIRGVDISKEMIRFAGTLFPKRLYPKLEFTEINSSADLQGQYDIILSFCVFHLVPDPLQVLIDLQNKLVDGGEIYLVLPGSKDTSFFQAAEKTFAKFGLEPVWQKRKAHGLSIKTLEGCQQLLEQAHLTIRRLEMLDDENLFIDSSEFLEWLKGTYTANWHIPFDQGDSFFSEMIRQMNELDPEFIDDQKVVHLKYPMIYVEATKSN